MKATSVPCVPSQERPVTAQGGRGGKGKEFDQIKVVCQWFLKKLWNRKFRHKVKLEFSANTISTYTGRVPQVTWQLPWVGLICSDSSKSCRMKTED